MSTSRRSSNSCTMKIGAVEIPVKTYTAFNAYGFGGHLHHKGCGERITQPRQCGEHGYVSGDEIFSAIDIAGKLVSLPEETRDSLLGRKDPITVISAIPEKEMLTMMQNGTFPVDAYFLEPEGIGEIKSPNLDAFKALMMKLEQRHRVLLVTIGIGGLKRNAILMPSGMLYTLSYTEELKERPEWSAAPSSELRSYMLDYVDKIASNSSPKFSLKRISNAVDSWLQSLIPAPRRNPKKSAKTTRKAKINA